MTSGKAARANAIGAIAILLWSTLAVVTALAPRLPPFQLTAMTFTVGGVLGFLVLVTRGEARLLTRLPTMAWLIGVGGLFGYHFLYFTALRSAPPAEARLINYLWPLLIVLMSAALPGERLRVAHVVGALMGLAGTALIVLAGGIAAIAGSALGYSAALAGAFAWSLYSVLSRRIAGVPSGAVAGFCLATALLAGLCHLALETTVWPLTFREVAAVLALGLGPVGAAFYAWDHAVKHGNIGLIGVLAYAAPLLSTLILVAFGFAEPGWNLAIACVLITLGAVIATVRWRRPAGTARSSQI